MSFAFKWPEFSPSFYDHAKHLLSTALNKGEKPPIIADKIQVNQLDMGTIPPDLEILEIGDLGRDRFRGIFRMTYAGDASICLQTKVQANPLRQQSNTSTPDILTAPSILFASTPLIVPMTLSLSSLKLRAIVVLVISRLEGVTLVFKNDPLESVQVSSTFDSLAAIQNFLQSEIERQLRDLFRTELPGIIHQLSRQWLKSNNPNDQSQVGVQSAPCSINTIPPTPTPPVPQASPNSNPTLSVPDQIESYDPTYGLRPSHPPLVGSFTRYRSLIQKKSNKLGLGVVLSPAEDEDDQQSEEHLFPAISTDFIDSEVHRPETLTPQQNQKKKTYPALGTSRIVKPKIFHSHSVGITNSDISLSGSSSHLGHQGTRSSSRTMDANGRIKWNNLEETSFNGSRQAGAPITPNLEQFPMHSCSSSFNGQPTMSTMGDPISTNQVSQNKNSASNPLNPLRPKPITRPPSSIFPSTPQSNVSHLPAYTLSHSGSPVPARISSPIFLASRSVSSMEEEHNHGEAEGQFEFEEGSQCALLASLVRGNWTLSPFSRSISHFAARSTPLGASSKNSRSFNRLSSPATLLSPHHQPSLLRDDHQSSSLSSRDSADLEGPHHRMSWLDSHSDGFKQKRVTRIKK